ncbi:hypothetical protein, partial [Ruegeria sp.]|uniref:hypothetical protein n=1 Tax=Ruegeria sp. TaxID=1879320 RepID=UPI002311EA6C
SQDARPREQTECDASRARTAALKLSIDRYAAVKVEHRNKYSKYDVLCSAFYCFHVNPAAFGACGTKDIVIAFFSVITQQNGVLGFFPPCKVYLQHPSRLVFESNCGIVFASMPRKSTVKVTKDKFVERQV